MKILRVMDRLNTGGPAIHAVLLTKHMNPGGSAPAWRTVLVVGKVGESEGDMGWLAEQEGVTPVLLPSLGRELHPIRDVATFWRLVQIIRAERPDVVHTHKSKAGAVGRLAAWVCGVPVIVHTFHGHVLHGYFGTAKTKAFRLIERAMALLSDRIVAVSPGVKADLVGYRVAPAEKIDVVSLGFDLGRFTRSKRGQGGLRAELGLGSGVPLIGIVARLVPIKDLAFFLEAARRVLAKRPDAVFAIAGDGELREELERRAAALGIAAQVRFLGFRSDLERIYPDLDVLCLTSANEGSPVSLIEGLASGCAAVSTDVGGVRDVLENGRLGVLVKPGDAEAFAGAVLALLADQPRRQALGEAGRRSALERYSIDRLVGDLDRLYRGLLESRSRRKPA
jgi:glycosyltransferase involved in cell wall biosynthesis